MNDFITSVGMNNFIFLILIISVILITIIILLIIERKKNVNYIEIEAEDDDAYYRNNNSYSEESYIDNVYDNNNQIQNTSTYNENQKHTMNNYNNNQTGNYDNYNYNQNLEYANNGYDEFNNISVENSYPVLEEEEVINPSYVEEIHNDDFSNNYEVSDLEEQVRDELLKEKEVIYYEEENTTPEEVKNKLDEIAKKLIDDNIDKSGPTKFEQDQEESSVISYEELKKINYDIDNENDRSMLEEEELPISINELYKKEKEQVEINNTREEELPISDEDEDSYAGKTFKNSEFISPVFGVYNKKASLSYKTEDLDKTVELEELEVEIRKTEEFLRELKKLKGKLD